jgi:hypothetical protein
MRMHLLKRHVNIIWNAEETSKTKSASETNLELPIAASSDPHYPLGGFEFVPLG